MRYFFHQIHKGERIPDLEGADFDNLAAARAEAILAARDIMGSRLRAGVALDHSVFEICDADGRILQTMPFQEALPIDDYEGPSDPTPNRRSK